MIIEALLKVRDVLMTELRDIDRRLLDAAKADPVARLLMKAPGVGVVVALSFKSAVDDPARFGRARDIGPWLGLTPRRYQSGKTDIVGRITKAGDARLRVVLYEAAAALLGRVRAWSALKAWGVRLAQRAGIKKARIAVARKLAVTLLSMWKNGMAFRWTNADLGTPAAA